MNLRNIPYFIKNFKKLKKEYSGKIGNSEEDYKKLYENMVGRIDLLRRKRRVMRSEIRAIDNQIKDAVDIAYKQSWLDKKAYIIKRIKEIKHEMLELYGRLDILEIYALGKGFKLLNIETIKFIRVDVNARGSYELPLVIISLIMVYFLGNTLL